jgi:hypothetical protein
VRARTRTSRYEPDAVEVALVLTRLAPDRAVVVGRLDWPFARPNGSGHKLKGSWITPGSQLGRQVGLSAPAAAERVRRMAEAGTEQDSH